MVASTARGTFPTGRSDAERKFLELRKKGLRVKAHWFRIRAKQLMEEMAPGAPFACFDGWLTRFKARHSVSLRRPTNTSQRPASDKENKIRRFHHNIQRLSQPMEGEEVKDVGRFHLGQIANMDQMPLPFTDGATYDEMGAQTVWVHGGASGLINFTENLQKAMYPSGNCIDVSDRLHYFISLNHDLNSAPV